MLVWDSFVEWTSERFHRASDAARERFVTWWERQQQPAWLRAIRYEIGWQLEEWRWRFGVWWSGKSETISEHSGRTFARIAEYSERAGSWLAAHLAPLANRCASWFYARSVIASERRATLKSALAELRDRRMEQLRQILGVRFSDAADVAARGIGGSGLRWKHGAAALVMLGAILVVSWALREPPPEPFSEREIQLVRSFVRPSSAPRQTGSLFQGKLPPGRVGTSR